LAVGYSKTHITEISKDTLALSNKLDLIIDMENKQALKPLIFLILTVATVFGMEKKFLVREARGETISHYSMKWVDNIILLIDDFEGLKGDSVSIQQASFFKYGNAHIFLDSSKTGNDPIGSENCLKVEWEGNYEYGGWGKGVGRNFDLNTETDLLNFRIFVPKKNGDKDVFKILIEEDDNHNAVLEKDKDDSWYYKLNVAGTDSWQFISIPLKDFKDDNKEGDGELNITRQGGLHTILFTQEHVEKDNVKHQWYFDFICFSNIKIPN
jgi:hypothetical protein